MLVFSAPLLTVAQKTALVIGVGACRGPLDARRREGEIHWLIRDAKKVRPKKCILSPRFIKTWLSNIHIIHRPLERQN
jgi:hypothetical protein